MADDTPNSEAQTQADIDKVTAKAADLGKNPRVRSYISQTAVYSAEGVYYKPGEPIVTAGIAGDDWELADAAEVAAITAAAKDKSPDVNFEELSVSQLRSVAAALGVAIPATVTKKSDIIVVLRAKNEPAL